MKLCFSDYLEVNSVGKRSLSMILSLVAMICVILPQYSAAATAGENGLYFMAVNDTVYPSKLEDSSMPVKQNGLIYVPYQLFDSATTGIALGTFCILNQTQNILVIYTRDQMLTFDLSAGTVSDQAGNTFTFHAITRNNTTYVPVYQVARYFGLQPALVSTDYGSLVRVTNASAVLSDAAFASAAVYILQDRLNDYETAAANNGTSGTDSTNTTPTQGNSTSTDGAATENNSQEKKTTPIYLAFRVEDNTDIKGLLALLSSRGISGIFFFKPEDLTSHDDEIRSILAAGHQIGFLVSVEEGADTNALLANLQSSNDVLRHIAQINTHFVLMDGKDATASQALDEKAWLRWSGNISGSSSTAILTAIHDASSAARITVSVSSAVVTLIARISNQLQTEGYSFHPVLETDF
jgi:hypothetical protein